MGMRCWSRTPHHHGRKMGVRRSSDAGGGPGVRVRRRSLDHPCRSTGRPQCGRGLRVGRGGCSSCTGSEGSDRRGSARAELHPRIFKLSQRLGTPRRYKLFRASFMAPTTREVKMATDPVVARCQYDARDHSVANTSHTHNARATPASSHLGRLLRLQPEWN